MEKKPDRRGYIQNLLYWKLSPTKNDHLANSILVLIAYRCYDGKSETYSGECFESNDSFALTFLETKRTISKMITLLFDNGYIFSENPNRKVIPRKLKLTEKTLKIIFSDTEDVKQKKIDLEILSNTNQKSIVQIDHVHSQNEPCSIVQTDHVHSQNEPCSIVRTDQHKRSNKRTIKKNSLNGQKESFEENQIEISGGNKFIEAIEQTGLMPEFKKIVTQFGRNPEKDTIPLIMDWASLDNNQSKRFSPEIIIKRFNGAIKNGFIPSVNSREGTLTKIKFTGKLI